MRNGKVYSETTIYAAPREFVAEAPYQLVIVAFDDASRTTGRVTGGAVKIDDPVELAEEKDGVPFFRRVGDNEA